MVQLPAMDNTERYHEFTPFGHCPDSTEVFDKFIGMPYVADPAC